MFPDDVHETDHSWVLLFEALLFLVWHATNAIPQIDEGGEKLHIHFQFKALLSWIMNNTFFFFSCWFLICLFHSYADDIRVYNQTKWPLNTPLLRFGKLTGDIMLLILKAGEFLQLESHFLNDNHIKAKSKTSIFFPSGKHLCNYTLPLLYFLPRPRKTESCFSFPRIFWCTVSG